MKPFDKMSFVSKNTGHRNIKSESCKQFARATFL